MDKATRKRMMGEIEALQSALQGEEVNGVKLLPGDVEWARRHIEACARLLTGASLIDA